MAKSATDDTTTSADSEPAKEAPAPKAAAPSQADKGKDSEASADSSLDHGKGPLEMSLKAYLKGSGRKPDQIAGFASYANREMPGRRTKDDWEQAFSDFYAKPLR